MDLRSVAAAATSVAGGYLIEFIGYRLACGFVTKTDCDLGASEKAFWFQTGGLSWQSSQFGCLGF